MKVWIVSRGVDPSAMRIFSVCSTEALAQKVVAENHEATKDNAEWFHFLTTAMEVDASR